MNNWTTTTGYPVLTITETSDETVFHVEQEIFLSSGEKVHPSPLWWNNVSFLTSNSSHVTKVDVKTDKATITIPEAKGSAWIKANTGHYGFFRVKYSPVLFSKLEAALVSGKLSTVDRSGLQTDTFALAKAGRISTGQVLKLLKAYVNETDFTIWTNISKNLNDIATVWGGEPNYPDFKHFVQQLYLPIHQKLGWNKKDGENDLDTLLRGVAIGKLGMNGYTDTINEAKKRFEHFLKDNSSLPADLRASVFSIVVANGDVKDWENVQKIYLESPLQEEKVQALRALGLAHDKDLKIRALEFSMSPQVRSQDMFIVFAAAAGSATGRDITWEFLKQKLPVLLETFGKGSFLLLGRTISYTIDSFVTLEQAAQVEAYFKANPVEPAKRTVEQGLEAIRTNCAWLARDKDSVAQVIKRN